MEADTEADAEADTEAEVYAIRYGTLELTRSGFFYDFASYSERDAPMRMDYLYFVVHAGAEWILVDCGFDPDVARRRGRTPLVDIDEGLAELGLGVSSIDRVVITHFHYDHIGNLGRFGDARLVAQAREVAFWQSPVGQRQRFAEVCEPGELALVDQAILDGRLEAIEDRAEIAPGVHLELVGGHTPGQQLVVVETGSGTLVLASDALHCYEEMELDRPFHHFCDLAGTYRAFDRLRELQVAGATIVAGHDPLVAARFAPEAAGSAVAIRLSPLSSTSA